jgi:hypothetical protein
LSWTRYIDQGARSIASKQCVIHQETATALDRKGISAASPFGLVVSCFFVVQHEESNHPIPAPLPPITGLTTAPASLPPDPGADVGEMAGPAWTGEGALAGCDVEVDVGESRGFVETKMGVCGSGRWLRSDRLRCDCPRSNWLRSDWRSHRWGITLRGPP